MSDDQNYICQQPPLRGDLPIIHLLDIRRFSRERMIGFVKSFDGNGTRAFYFSRRAFF
jgi:hypothetical protein